MSSQWTPFLLFWRLGQDGLVYTCELCRHSHASILLLRTSNETVRTMHVPDLRTAMDIADLWKVEHQARGMAPVYGSLDRQVRT